MLLSIGPYLQPEFDWSHDPWGVFPSLLLSLRWFDPSWLMLVDVVFRTLDFRTCMILFHDCFDCEDDRSLIEPLWTLHRVGLGFRVWDLLIKLQDYIPRSAARLKVEPLNQIGFRVGFMTEKTRLLGIHAESLGSC